MKVYIAVESDWDYFDIIGVYAKEEDAKAAADSTPGGLVEEWEVQ